MIQLAMQMFLVALREAGSVRVLPAREPPPPVDAAADEVLRAMEATARVRAPGCAPDLHLPAARWAARMLYRACQLFADRTADAATVARDLALRGPGAALASTQWSVDLTLRWLPDVARLTRGLAPDDPLLAALRRLGAAWPLSSIGMPLGDEAPAPCTPRCLREDSCLRLLYVERVLASGDVSRLSEAWVAEAAAAVVGAHPTLAPRAAAAVATAGPGQPREERDG